MIKNNIAILLSSFSFMMVTVIALWGGNFIIVAIAICCLIGSFLFLKNNKIGKWICLIGVLSQILFLADSMLYMFKEFVKSGSEPYVIIGGAIYTVVPLIYLIVTLVFIIKSKVADGVGK